MSKMHFWNNSSSQTTMEHDRIRHPRPLGGHCKCRTFDLNTFVLFHKGFILILHLMEGKKTPEVHWQFRQMEELKVEK